MNLSELITALEAADPNLVLPEGFANPHSYRGDYYDLAFEPAANVTVAQMLADARSALGRTFEGYKGGTYDMDGYTDVWIALHGCNGEPLGPIQLAHMIAAGIVFEDFYSDARIEQAITGFASNLPRN